MRARHLFVLLLLPPCCLTAWSGMKAKDMSIHMDQTDGCTRSFAVEQDPTPFLKHVREVKEKGVVKFRGGNRDVFQQFPAEIELNIYYRPVSVNVLSKSSSTCTGIDFNALKFKATWSNRSRSLPAQGTVLNAVQHPPEPFCEDKCSPFWSYALRIESAGVPLTDDLIIEVTSGNGVHVATLRGGLGPLEHKKN